MRKSGLVLIWCSTALLCFSAMLLWAIAVAARTREYSLLAEYYFAMFDYGTASVAILGAILGLGVGLVCHSQKARLDALETVIEQMKANQHDD